MDWLFLLSTSFILYTYLMYPIAIWLASKRSPNEPAQQIEDEACPHVTVVITVHNEETRVERKIRNIRSLDYPQDKIDILIVSDGSTDRTTDILKNQPNIRYLAYPERRGKAYALNQALQTNCHDIILFNDVRQAAEPGAMRYVISSLMQPGIGAVSGELMHHDPSTNTAANIGLYWRYEKWIRKSESDFRSVVGATGAFYAIRKELFEPLPPNTLLDDFEIPMQIAKKGYRVLFEQRALIYDNLQETLQGERTRKMRTLSGNFQSLAHHPWMLSPAKNPLWIQLISHKVCRLLTPYAMILALGSSLASTTPVIQALSMAQLVFYILAWLAYRHPPLARNRLINFAVVFCDLNLVALKAGIQFLTGRLNTTWEKT